MTHKAETILENIKTSLTGLVTTGTKVERGRAWPIDEAALPALTINMGADQALDDQTSGLINRVLNFEIVAHVRDTTGVETTLNQIKTEVFAALMANPTQTGTVIDTELVEDSEPEIESEQNQPIARMAQQWRVYYRHSATSTES